MSSTQTRIASLWQLIHGDYVVVPRTLIEGMSEDWQARFRDMLLELHYSFPGRPDFTAAVTLRDNAGRFIHARKWTDEDLARMRMPGGDAVAA